MGTNGTHRSHARCHPYPIPQPVEVGHTTGVYVPYSFRTENRSVKVLWDGTYGFSSLSEKTRKFNHLQMSLRRPHFVLSYLKTLSVGPAGVWTRDLPLSRPALYQLGGKKEITFKRQNKSFLFNKYTSKALYQTLQTTKMNFENLLRYNKFSKTHNCNPFQSSSSLSIWASFCTCCVIYNFF